MRRAIELSARGLGTTSPNPVVGAVLLDAAGQVVGEGFHAKAGGPHAEVVALGAAGFAARGGTAVVTLEPCNATGRTGPCVAALLAAGIRRVVYAASDPTPAGGGGEALRSAGVEVDSGLLASEAALVNEAWLHAVGAGRPFVVWKSATTLDGRVAAADGSSRWVTGPEARADVHLLRSQLDAVLVGSGTVLADDPQLTVRDDGGRVAGRQPLRVVLDRRGRVPVTARIRDEAAPSLVLHESDPGEALRLLYERGVRSVLLEGGPTMTAAFLACGLVDKVVAYIAPALLGEGPVAVAPFGVGSIGGARRFQITDVRLVGGDVRVTAYPAAEEG
jgi:diaminohydroxyphosphoribosylaminopyrimidine deaminase/5-amino-6-(5-phosphoribosylamino)uracil reductase